MQITVQEIGKFGGIKIGTDYVAPSKFANGLPKFEVGKTYEIEIKENVSKKDGKTYRNIVAAKEIVANTSEAVAPVVALKTEEAPKSVVEKKAPKTKPVVDLNIGPYFGADGLAQAISKKPIAFGRELSDYEVLKDRRIGVAGVVQAVIQSPIYQMQAELMEPTVVDKFLADKAEFWLSEIKRLSEGK